MLFLFYIVVKIAIIEVCITATILARNIFIQFTFDMHIHSFHGAQLLIREL